MLLPVPGALPGKETWTKQQKKKSVSSLGLPQEIADRRKLVGLFHSMSFQSSIALEDKNNGKNRQGYLLRERERVK